MASNIDQGFDRSLLPEVAQRLQVDADGNVNAVGNLREHLGPRAFRIEAGRLTIIDRGTERAPNPQEYDEVRHVLNAPLRRDHGHVQINRNGNHPLFQLILSDGGNDRTVPDAWIKVTREQLDRAAEAHKAREEAEAARVDAERKVAEDRQRAETAFVSRWGGNRKNLGSLPRHQETLQAAASSATADTAARRFSNELHKAQNNHAGTRAVHEELNEYLHALHEFDRYEQALGEQARSEKIDLTKTPFSVLLIGREEGRAALKSQLTTLRDQASRRLDELADINSFVQEANTEWGRVAEEIDTESGWSLLHLSKQCATTASARVFVAGYQTGITTSNSTGNPEAATRVLINDLLKALTALETVGGRIQEMATKRGINLSEPHFTSLNNLIRPAGLREAIDGFTQLRTQVSAHLSVQEGVLQGEMQARRGLTQAEEDSFENIATRGSDLALAGNTQRLAALNTAINEQTDDATLTATGEELGEIEAYLTHLQTAATQTQTHLEQTIAGLPTETFNRAGLVRSYTERRDHLAQALATITSALATITEIRTRIGELETQRGTARGRLARHNRPAPPTRLQQAQVAVTGAVSGAWGAITGAARSALGARAAVEGQIGEVVRERAAAETTRTGVNGTVGVDLAGASENVLLYQGEVYRRNLDDEGNVVLNEDGNETHVRVADNDVLQQVAQSLNTGTAQIPDGTPPEEAAHLRPADRVSFVVDEDTGTIQRVRRGSTETTDGDRLRGIGRAVVNAGNAGADRLVGTLQARREQAEVRAALGRYITANNLIPMVTEMQAEGMTRDQIVNDLRAALDGANPGQAEEIQPGFYGDIYDEIVRLQTADRTSPVKRAGRWVRNDLQQGWQTARDLTRASPGFFRNQFNRVRNWWNGTNAPAGTAAPARPAAPAAPSRFPNLVRNVAIGAGVAVAGTAAVVSYGALKLIGKGIDVGVAGIKSIPAVAKGGGLLVAGALNGVAAGLGEPLTEMSAGAVNAWNYFDEPNYSEMKEAKGWTSPFTWMGNGLRRAKNALQWTADKALRTVAAVPTGAAGLVWGALGAVPTFVGVTLAGSEHGRYWSRNLVPDLFGGADGKATVESGKSAAKKGKPALTVVAGGKSKEDHHEEDHPKEDHPKEDHPKEDHAKHAA
jgi:hypothetical protein